MSPFDRSRPPTTEAARPARFPELVDVELTAGFRLIACPRPGSALVHLELLFDRGGDQDAVAVSGLANLTGALLDEGTSGRSSQEIAALVERRGAQLGSGATWETTYLSAGGMADDLGLLLELMAEITEDAALPEEELERLRRQVLTEIERRQGEPATLASEHLQRVLYADSPYAQPLLGTRDSISQLTRQQVVEQRHRHLRRPMALIAVGGLDPAEAATRIDELFPRQSVERAATTSALAFQSPAQVEVHVIDRPNAPQTELRIGQPGLPRTSGDFLPAVVLNSVLGGKFTSRINLSLRERMGLTYGAHSGFSWRRGRGPFTVSTAVSTEGTGRAVTEVLRQLERLRNEPVPASELQEAKDYLIGVFPYTLQTLDGLAARIERIPTFGLALDEYDRYCPGLAAVTAQEVRDVAERTLAPQRLAVVAVGPAERLIPQLEPLGELRRWSRAGDPLPEPV